MLSGALIFAGLLAYISGSPFVFIELFHVPPERFGLFFGANAIGHHRRLADQPLAGRPLRRAAHRRRRAAGRDDRGSRCCWSTPPRASAGSPGILVPLFCFIACHGFVMPNTTALAMAPHGAVAGSASALLGTLQFVLGATAGALVGVLGNGTAVPLAAVIAGCGVAAFLTHHTVVTDVRASLCSFSVRVHQVSMRSFLVQRRWRATDANREPSNRESRALIEPEMNRLRAEPERERPLR